jgi:hypothetical protein
MGIVLAIIPFFIISLFNLGTVIFAKRKYGSVLPLSLFAICLLMFVSQFIFSTFYVAYILVGAFCAFSVFWLAFLAIKHRDRIPEIRRNFLSPGFIISAILYVVFLIIFYKTAFTGWDNFSHWGPMVKEMLRLDKFYSVPEAAVPFHKDYPPIVGLFEVFFAKLGGGYSEGIVILAAHVLQFSVLLPVIENIKKHTLSKGLAVAFIATMLTLFMDSHLIFNSIYNDYLIAFLTAFGLYLAIFAERNKFNLIYLLATILFLSYIKEIAVVFAAVIALAYFIRSLQKQKAQKWYKRLLVPVSICLIALFGFFSWKFIIRNTETDRQFDLNNAKGKSLICPIIANCSDDYRNVAAINFYKAVFTKGITNANVDLSYAQLVAGTSLIFYLIYRRTKRSKDDKNRLKNIYICYLSGALIYAGVMFFTYTTLFDDNEGPNLASFNRYMNTYILVGLIFALYYYVVESIAKDSLALCVLCCALFLVQSPENLERITPNPISYQEQIYAVNLQTAINQEDEEVIIYYHALFRYNFFRYFALDNYFKTKAVPIPEESEEFIDVIKENSDKRFMLIDFTDEELEALEEEFGQKFKNGNVFSIE